MSERAQRIDELFEKALELDADGRRSLLASAGDLRDEVERLLGAHAAMAEDFLGAPAVVDLPGLEARGLDPDDEVGGYTIERVVGRGGGGTVYAARQQHPNRIVALKVMRGGLTTEAAVTRFLAEAEILARLKHVGIAHVYEAGVQETLPYFVMEFVEGEPLRRAGLETFARICDAVHHGHLKGVVHRDLKPGNILVDAEGQTKIIDFGIARAGDGTEREILGTPKYMAPELKAGDEVDARTDVFSLGILLDAVAERRTRDLAAIVARACEPRPDDRYPSAAALAADVRRHARHEPVEARPASWPYHVALFARRRTAAVVALAALLAVLVAAVAVSLRFAADARRERDEQRYQNYLANIAGAQAALRADDTGELRRRLAAAPEQWRGWEWRHLSGMADDSLRTVPWPGVPIFHGAIGRDCVVALGAERGRGILRAWNVPGSRVRFTASGAADEEVETAVEVSPDGATLATGGRRGAVRLRDARTGAILRVLDPHEDMVNDVAFLPGGAIASASADGTVRIWRESGGLVLRGHKDRVVCLQLLPDGRLASGGRLGEVRIWNVASGSCERILRAHAVSVEDIAVDGAGKLMATCSRDSTVRFWDFATWTCTAVGRGHDGNVRSAALSRDGTFAVTGGYDRTVRIWDVASGRERACLRGHDNLVRRVALHDEDRVAVSFARDATVRFWPVDRSSHRFELHGHRATVTNVALSPDGTQLASCGLDGTARIWSLSSRAVTATTGDGVHTTAGARAFLGVSWLDDERLLVADRERVAVLRPDGRTGATWPVRVARLTPLQPKDSILRVATTEVVVLSREPFRAGVRKTLPRRAIHATDYSPRAGLVALARPEELLIAQLREDGRVLRRRAARGARSIAFSLDGMLLAIGEQRGLVRIVRTSDLTDVVLLEGHVEAVSGVSFHPGGQRLATCGGATVRLWDTGAWQQVAVFDHPHGSCVAFSSDGRTLAAGSTAAADSVIRVWTVDPARLAD